MSHVLRFPTAVNQNDHLSGEIAGFVALVQELADAAVEPSGFELGADRPPSSRMSDIWQFRRHICLQPCASAVGQGSGSQSRQSPSDEFVPVAVHVDAA